MKVKIVSLLMVMSFYCLLLCSHMFVVSGLCLDDQKSLLLQFKNNFTFHPTANRSTSRLKSWNVSHDCCMWMGVTCDKDGHVTCLDLSEESIIGGFDDSSSLFSLRHLQKLNFANNDIYGSINNKPFPSKFNKLEKLTYLNLSFAGFKGQIPEEISQLTRLVTLDISGWPNWTKLENPNLRKLVQNLTSIKQLYLAGVSIIGQGNEWCDALLSLHDLQELSMGGCNLSGPLHPSLARLENLSVIILDGNNLSSPVPETFANFKNLTTLYLSSCGLTGTFPHKIFQIGMLSYIDISRNDDLHGFFPDFLPSGSLRTIRVSATNFSGAIPNSISNLRHLSILELFSCQFNGTLPNSLSNLTELDYMDLSSNNFTGSMPSFGMAMKLTDLYLSGNYLSGVIPSTSHTKGLLNLSRIDLSDNSFSGSIPSSLFQFPSLHQIQLSHNQFSQIDEFINVSSSLLYNLDISNNNLSGLFPVSFFQLSHLTTLHLSSNKFSGPVQLNEFSELKNLFLLDLSYNNLTVNVNVTIANLSSFPNFDKLYLASCNLKTFPTFLRSQSSLRYLDLSNNQIQGTVPNWIWKLDSLEILNISHNLLTDLERPLESISASSLFELHLNHNQLQGPKLVFPKYAASIDYSSNKFSSVIPQDIGNYLSSMAIFNLSNNTLHGTIPYSICNASILVVLDLSFNKISGVLPSCLMMMSNTLEVLNLKNNNLSGNISDTIPSSCAIWALNLHGNLLDGPIPNSLTYCSKLEILDLGSNHITGAFPCFLKKISTLRILVLRNNKFHGSLRCLEPNKTWPMLQIMDIAFNNISGKLPRKYFKSWETMMYDEDLATSKFSNQLNIGDSLDFHYSVTIAVTSTNKGQLMELVKILTIFTSIDFSSNQFKGPIPEELMDFKALHVLNLSNNALSGEIPPSIGNLKQLESLDLSRNSLSGEIPMQVVSLSFLSYLNLSFNHLEGKIPTGTQIQSFQASSFEGNDGLYGPPLIEKSNGKEPRVPPRPTCGRLACSIDWNFISVELGLVFGLGLVFAPLLFWKRWRIWYCQLVHNILCWIFPQLYLEYVTRRGQTYAVLRWWY